jgi:hypothetical protein
MQKDGKRSLTPSMPRERRWSLSCGTWAESVILVWTSRRRAVSPFTDQALSLPGAERFVSPLSRHSTCTDDPQFRDLPDSPGYIVPTEIPEPEKILDQYTNAAKIAKEAGFDGVELHSANGYLVEQFLSDSANVRTDKWGGSVENRCRFGLEAVKRLIDVWGADRVG